MKKSIFSLSLLVCLALSLSACYTVPITGRSSLNMVTQAESKELGETAFADAKKQTPLSKDVVLNQRVQKVGKNLSEISHYPDWDWEFIVFDQPEVPNAWCLPGGKVAIYSGLMPYIKTDAELATVLSHEIAHAVARHGAERMTQNMLKTVGAEIITSSVDARYKEAASTVYGVSSDVFVMLPYSRKHEYEADKIGLMYMAKAGYDPNEALNFWQRFSQLGGGGSVPEFLSTHPADEKRIESIRTLIPEAIEYKNTPEEELEL